MYVEKQVNGVNKIIGRMLEKSRLLKYFGSIHLHKHPHVNYS